MACGTCEAKKMALELDAMYTCGAWEHVSYPMKEDLDGGGSNEIGVALVRHKARGRFC